MKRIFTFLAALILLSLGKTYSQFCVSLDCAAPHTGITTDGGLPDRPGSEIGNACYSGANYKQVFWEFFFSGAGGDFAQTFTPTIPADGLDLDWFVYDVGPAAPPTTCPVDVSTWAIIPLACSNAATIGTPTGPGTETTVTTIPNEYYAVAIISWQAITSTFDISIPTLDNGGGPQPLAAVNCPGLLLPVKLASFSSRVNNCIVNLDWTATSESGFKDYEVQSSSDGANFHTIADMAAVANTSLQKYSYQHANPQQGKIYYRLKMVDLDGHFEYSKTIAMKLDCSKAQFLVYPNPVKDILNVNITNSQNVTFAKLFDNTGKLIYSNNLVSGTNLINMGNFAKGVYLLQLVNNTATENIKIVK